MTSNIKKVDAESTTVALIPERACFADHMANKQLIVWKVLYLSVP